jgi:hypothetical protein
MGMRVRGRSGEDGFDDRKIILIGAHLLRLLDTAEEREGDGFAVFVSAVFLVTGFVSPSFSLDFDELFVYTLVDGGAFSPGFVSLQFDVVEEGPALETGLVFAFRCLGIGDLERSAAGAAQHVGDVTEFRTACSRLLILV